MPTALATFDEPARWDLYGWSQFDIYTLQGEGPTMGPTELGQPSVTATNIEDAQAQRGRRL